VFGRGEGVRSTMGMKKMSVFGRASRSKTVDIATGSMVSATISTTISISDRMPLSQRAKAKLWALASRE
jgi:hypothetical protein